MKSLRKSKISALLTAVVIFVSVIAVGIVIGPRLLGMRAFSVDSASMEPTIKEGSLVYVKCGIKFDDYYVGDIVTFSDDTHQNYFTHRIAEINLDERSFTTRGDANNDNDPSAAGYTFAVGKVQLAIPYLGKLSVFLRNKYVKIAVALIYISWAAIEIEIFKAERKKRDE